MDITSPCTDRAASTGCGSTRASGVIDLERSAPSVATLVQPNQPTHDISLPRRNLRDCLAEELRRLDPDDLFGEVVQRGLPQLDAPGRGRAEKAAAREAAAAEGEFMSNERRVLVHPDKQTLAGSVAARFITKIVDVLDDLGEANVCLTGGTMGAAVLRRHQRLAGTRQRRLEPDHLLVGRRAVPAARATPIATTPSREPRCSTTSTSMPRRSSRSRRPGDQPDIEQAARYYEQELAAAARMARRYPRFDITFLGVGPDGHIASLFPDHDAVHETERVVVAETDSPKPPPERLSLTLPVINSSDRIWLVLAGADKASALGLALAGASINDVPAAGAEGRRRTVFFVDQEAAAEVPESLIAPSYYWTVGRRQPDDVWSRVRGFGRRAETMLGRLAATRPQLVERLVEKLLGLFLGATLLHVGQVRLVRLHLGELRRIVLVAAGRQTRVRAVDDVGDLLARAGSPRSTAPSRCRGRPSTRC